MVNNTSSLKEYVSAVKAQETLNWVGPPMCWEDFYNEFLLQMYIDELTNCIIDIVLWNFVNCKLMSCIMFDVLVGVESFFKTKKNSDTPHTTQSPLSPPEMSNQREIAT